MATKKKVEKMGKKRKRKIFASKQKKYYEIDKLDC